MPGIAGQMASIYDANFLQKMAILLNSHNLIDVWL